MSSDDPYLKLIDEQWHNIIMMYEAIKDKKPIIEYDVMDEKIYLYPAKDYIRAIGDRTRKHAKKQYREAVRKNQFMLFIKDSENQILRSYIFDLPPRNSP